MKLFFHLLTFFIAIGQSPAQKAEVFRTPEGHIYSVPQKDSLERHGNYVWVKETTKKKDTIYNEIIVYDLNYISATALQKKYVGKELPRIALESMEGKIVNNDFLRGKVTLINFWTADDESSIQEFEQLNQLKAKFKDQLNFIAVAPNSKEEIRTVLNRHHLDYTILANADQFIKSIGIDSYPVSFFIDEKGIVTNIIEGVYVKSNHDGTIFTSDGEWVNLNFEKFTRILELMLEK